VPDRRGQDEERLEHDREVVPERLGTGATEYFLQYSDMRTPASARPVRDTIDFSPTLAALD